MNIQTQRAAPESVEELKLISAEELYYKQLTQPKLLIDGLLPNGLAVLSGDSKIGKSWLVLWLCLQISRGEPVWGRPTRQCRLSGPRGHGKAHPETDDPSDR